MQLANLKNVLVTGSLAFDHIMNLPGKFDEHIMPDKVHMLNVSFVVDTFRREYGGTAGNITYAMALLGMKPVLVSAVGDDFGEYGRFLEKAGVDLSRVVVDKSVKSASGFVMTDLNDNQIWSFFPGPSARAVEQSVSPAEFVLIAPTVQNALVFHLKQVVEKGMAFSFDPAFYIPTIPAEMLRLGIEKAQVVFGNDYEMELMSRKIGKDISSLVSKDTVLVTTLGVKGSRVERKGEVVECGVAKRVKMVDPTGAGDAYRAGFMAGYLSGKELMVCARMGSVSASFAIESYGTQNYGFSMDEYQQRYSESYGEELNISN